MSKKDLSKKLRPGEKLQRLVKAIEEALSGDEHTTIESPAFVADRKTGALREHDVLIIRRTPHRTFVTAIECKDHSRPVGITIVEAFKTKCDDTGIDKGVIVSSRGFTATASQKAKIFGIDCLTLEQANLQEWKFMYEIVKYNRRILRSRINAVLEGDFTPPAILRER